jgi:hypothetical protein
VAAIDKDSTCAKIAQVQNEGNRHVSREVVFSVDFWLEVARGKE